MLNSSHSFLRNADSLLRRLILTCGYGRVLLVGCGDGSAVQAMLALGLDAFGICPDSADNKQAEAALGKRLLKGDLTKIGSAEGEFDLVCVVNQLECLDEKSVPKAFKELRRISKGSLYIEVSSTDHAKDRAWYTQKALENGFRHHPWFFAITSYENLDSRATKFESLLEVAPLEKVESSDDFLADVSPAAEAEFYRYTFASQYARPGDVILDLTRKPGAGTYVLAKTTPASIIKTVVEPNKSFPINRFSPASKDRIQVTSHDPVDLKSLPDNSIDLIIAEILSSTSNSEDLFKEAFRVIRPSGRVMAVFPTKSKANYEKIKGRITRDFLLEDAYFQSQRTAHSGGRFRRASDAEVPESDWCVIVGMVSPLLKPDVPFTETVYPYSAPPANLLEFGRDYRNPWLVRAMVEGPFRLRNREALESLCDEVLRSSPTDSADYGAALCVRGYRLLEQPPVIKAKCDEILKRIAHYTSVSTTVPHVHRWIVSLLYLKGEILRRLGDLEGAKESFRACLEKGVSQFSPVLGTKTIHAAINLAVGSLAAGDHSGAIENFKRGSQELLTMLKQADVFVGKPDMPLTCTHLDLLDLVDHGMYCSIAITSAKFTEKDGRWGRELRLGTIRGTEAAERASLLAQLSDQQEQRESAIQQVAHMQSELERLATERQELFQTAELRLADLNRLGRERQELFETAEQRLAELHRLGQERNDLYNTAEERLRELQRLGNERTELYETAEKRLAELQNLSKERNELYETAEGRLLELQRIGKEREELFNVAEQRVSEIKKLETEREVLRRKSEEKLSSIESLREEKSVLLATIDQKEKELEECKLERSQLAQEKQQLMEQVALLSGEQTEAHRILEERLSELQRSGETIQRISNENVELVAKLNHPALRCARSMGRYFEYLLTITPIKKRRAG